MRIEANNKLGDRIKPSKNPKILEVDFNTIFTWGYHLVKGSKFIL